MVVGQFGNFMRYQRFGRTGWDVSALSLGTVEFGVEYGLYGCSEKRSLAAKDAVKIMLHAFEQGVNLVDTAPNYGESERVVGRALKEWSGEVFVATKITLTQDKTTDINAIVRSIDASLHALGRDVLDLVQIHNATVADLQREELNTLFSQLRQAGKVRCFGTSLYGVDTAHAALDNEHIAVLQVAFNLLDQRMAESLFVAAKEKDIALLGRSALLKGALTERHHQLPPSLAKLKEGVLTAQAWAHRRDDRLSSYALHFCLSQPALSTVLIGVRTKEELDAALEVALRPPIFPQALDSARSLALQDETIIDPRNWAIP